ncbi:hypothetical protein RQP46_010386 [Phenoliferia psychrophenolica]
MHLSFLPHPPRSATERRMHENHLKPPGQRFESYQRPKRRALKDPPGHENKRRRIVVRGRSSYELSAPLSWTHADTESLSTCCCSEEEEEEATLGEAEGAETPGPACVVATEQGIPDKVRARWDRGFLEKPANHPVGRALLRLPLCVLILASSFDLLRQIYFLTRISDLIPFANPDRYSTLPYIGAVGTVLPATLNDWSYHLTSACAWLGLPAQIITLNQLFYEMLRFLVERRGWKELLRRIKDDTRGTGEDVTKWLCQFAPLMFLGSELVGLTRVMREHSREATVAQLWLSAAALVVLLGAAKKGRETSTGL